MTIRHRLELTRGGGLVSLGLLAYDIRAQLCAPIGGDRIPRPEP